MEITRKIFKNVLWATIEDYTRLLHLIPEIYNEINDRYDSYLTVAKKVLLFYLENDYVALFYENWKIFDNYIEIPKEKALYLLMETVSWENPNKGDLWITVSATKKEEDLYYTDKILNDNFKLPIVL